MCRMLLIGLTREVVRRFSRTVSFLTAKGECERRWVEGCETPFFSPGVLLVFLSLVQHQLFGHELAPFKWEDGKFWVMIAVFGTGWRLGYVMGLTGMEAVWCKFRSHLLLD